MICFIIIQIVLEASVSLTAGSVQDGKKRVVFKRQKYHCVYEYPREVADLDAPDYSTYAGT